MHATHPPLRESAQAHIDTLDAVDDHSAQLIEHASRAFYDTAPELLVPIPVAYSETPETVHTALEQFADQASRRTPPFWVGLSINGPPGKQSQAEALAEEVENIKAEYPELPLSYYTTSYDSNTFSIGRVRRDLVGAVASACLQLRGDFTSHNTSLVMNDIDLKKVSPNYLPSLHGTLLSGASFAQAPWRNSRSGGVYPNMDRVLFWHNLPLAVNPLARQGSANAISLHDYFSVDGYLSKDTIMEDSSLCDRILTLSNDGHKILRATGAYAVYDSRREYAYLQQGVSPRNVWQDGGFNQGDDYRNGNNGLQDISQEAANAQIEESIAQKGFYGVGRTRFDSLEWLMMRQHVGDPSERFAPDGWTPTNEESQALAQAHQYIQRLKHAGRIITANSL